MGAVPPFNGGTAFQHQHRRSLSLHGRLPVLAHAKHRVCDTPPLSGIHGVPTTSGILPCRFVFRARTPPVEGWGHGKRHDVSIPSVYCSGHSHLCFFYPRRISGRCAVALLSLHPLYSIAYVKRALLFFASKALMKKDLAQRLLRRTRSFFLAAQSFSQVGYVLNGSFPDCQCFQQRVTVMRTTGATEDDLRVLASREFIRVLNEDLVSYITDWKRNNLIKKDRYQPSVYHSLLVQIEDGTQMEPEWNPSGTQVEPQDRLGKDRGESGADKPPARPRFVPPTVEQVAAYVKERGSRVDPQGFVDFYSSKGWMVGKTPMKDWKAACRNAESWERWNRAGDTRSTVKTAADYNGEDDFLSTH